MGWLLLLLPAPRAGSNVGVASGSITSSAMLSEALDGLHASKCSTIALEAGGGMEMLVRSTLPLFVSGSDDRAFRVEAGVVVPEESRCGFVHECELSELTVRVSDSIRLQIPR
jgi:hypothetical protein